jgi:hypothetical protein
MQGYRNKYDIIDHGHEKKPFMYIFHRSISTLDELTDYGHPERAFFQKFETFGLGQTN